MTSKLDDRLDFVDRHVGPSASEQAKMLAELGFDSLDALVEAAMPAAIAMQGDLELPAARNEAAVLARLGELAGRNKPLRAMIGLGFHGTVTPAVIRRGVLEDPSWYTAYTPYQPEISQGRLEALLNFQTMVTDLTALDVAGSSLLDGATAAAEAMAMAKRLNPRAGDVFLVDPGVLPATLAVIRTRARAIGIEVVVAETPLAEALSNGGAFAVLVAAPASDGTLRPTDELTAIAEAAHGQGALVIADVDLLALTLVTPPGEWGADIAVGSTQRLGVPLFHGGPHAGFIAVREAHGRQLPGRLVGVSVDADGAPALRLALQTREQHIRREKATSNICTAQVLLAVVASMYAVYHGPGGLIRIATEIHERARRLAGALVGAGIELAGENFFDTLTATVPGRASEIVAAAREAGVHLRLVDADHVGVSVGEDATENDLAAVAEAFGVGLDADPIGSVGEQGRTSEFLTHPVFNAYHSETRLMRYLHTLSGRDFALDQGMIPLGSCTMKLNSAIELEPISYPGFANLHPYAPAADAEGYAELIDELSAWLVAATGYAAVSLQPNSGAQGEFAGLTAIRRYHEANGDTERDVCLIPASAHGTNAASAAMAGLRVVVVKTAADGSIDLDDLSAKIEANAGRIAAAMVTYPSTHGAFEEGITKLCELVHEAGGQVYIDGANMNAIVGLAQPGRFGGDVSHLNLHKTFAIPHGGGGPGVGPVAVAEHLAPFLPSHPFLTDDAEDRDTIAGSPWGSAGVLPISYAYIALMGADGLRTASQVALLNANYVAHRLAEHYPVLYKGKGDLVAHECILDLRPLTAATKVSVDDVAKRLIDYGFHAPTMSFPVAGTLMVEPTESEDLDELDRFCDAMIAIRAEIDQVAAGEWPGDDNPLHNAPHTQDRISADEWVHPYSRTTAAYPLGRRTGLVQGAGVDKYWPAAARIDGAYGDRNLVCSCPPISEWAE